MRGTAVSRLPGGQSVAGRPLTSRIFTEGHRSCANPCGKRLTLALRIDLSYSYIDYYAKLNSFASLLKKSVIYSKYTQSFHFSWRVALPEVATLFRTRSVRMLPYRRPRQESDPRLRASSRPGFAPNSRSGRSTKCRIRPDSITPRVSRASLPRAEVRVGGWGLHPASGWL